MLEYRLYCLDEEGKFKKAHDIEANDDAEAISKAECMQIEAKCELWQRNRLVAELPGQSEARL